MYVGDLGNDGTRDELEDAFTAFGAVKNIWIAKKPPGKYFWLSVGIYIPHIFTYICWHSQALLLCWWRTPGMPRMLWEGWMGAGSAGRGLRWGEPYFLSKMYHYMITKEKSRFRSTFYIAEYSPALKAFIMKCILLLPYLQSYPLSTNLLVTPRLLIYWQTSLAYTTFYYLTKKPPQLCCKPYSQSTTHATMLPFIHPPPSCYNTIVKSTCLLISIH